MVRLLTRLDPQCLSIREHLLSRYKADKAIVSAVARYADMVAGWDPYDQNASSEFFDLQHQRRL
jgi:hypothetical protein